MPRELRGIMVLRCGTSASTLFLCLALAVPFAVAESAGERRSHKRVLALSGKSQASVRMTSSRSGPLKPDWSSISAEDGSQMAPGKSFQCGSHNYTLKGDAKISDALKTYGVVTANGGGDKKLAKLTSLEGGGLRRFQREEAVLQALVSVDNVPNLEDSCQFGSKSSGVGVIILSEALEDAKYLDPPLNDDVWWMGGPTYGKENPLAGKDGVQKQITTGECTPRDNAKLGAEAAKLKRALEEVFKTVWAILKADIANPSQHRNLWFKKDGTPIFMSFEEANDRLSEVQVEEQVTLFLKSMFNLIPPLMLGWAEDNLIKKRESISDFADRIVKDYWSDWRSSEGEGRAAAEKEKWQPGGKSPILGTECSKSCTPILCPFMDICSPCFMCATGCPSADADLAVATAESVPPPGLAALAETLSARQALSESRAQARTKRRRMNHLA